MLKVFVGLDFLVFLYVGSISLLGCDWFHFIWLMLAEETLGSNIHLPCIGRNLRQEDHEFETRLVYVVRMFKNQKATNQSLFILNMATLLKPLLSVWRLLLGVLGGMLCHLQPMALVIQ